jgi:glycine cleavage system regulatory protein
MMFSRLDIPSHSKLATANRRFSEVARSKGSWDGVTGLKATIGDDAKCTLQITMTGGQTHSTVFTDIVAFVCFIE